MKEKKNNYAKIYAKEKRKKKIMIMLALSIFMLIIISIIYIFITSEYNNLKSPVNNAGKLGDEHVHSSLLVRIFGDKFDFSLPAYQIKSSWIHFESRDGTTIHRHSSGITLGYLFETLGITINDQCYIFPDNREFCTNDEYTLKFYINHEYVSDINKYVINNNDRILISYGNENIQQITNQLLELDSQKITK